MPHSPNQQPEAVDLSILAKSSLGLQNNFSGINCSVGIFRVLWFMDSNYFLIRNVLPKVFLVLSTDYFTFLSPFCVAREVVDQRLKKKYFPELQC